VANAVRSARVTAVKDYTCRGTEIQENNYYVEKFLLTKAETFEDAVAQFRKRCPKAEIEGVFVDHPIRSRSTALASSHSETPDGSGTRSSI
jgi:hypothetical protein